jgi:hypothetical protein
MLSIRRPGELERGGNGHPGGPGTFVRAIFFFSSTHFLRFFLPRRRERRL